MEKIEIPPELSERSKKGVDIQQTKGKVLFVVLFILLLLICNFLYVYIYNLFLPWHGTIFDVFYLISYIVIFLTLTIFISGKISIYLMQKEFMLKHFKLIITILVLIPMIIFAINKIDEYREKNLGDLVSYFPEEKFVTLEISLNKESDVRLSTENFELTQEFINFLSHYDVKIMKDNDWESRIPRGINFTIITEDKAIMGGIYEERLYVMGTRYDAYYHVVDDSIDISWLENFIIENQ